MRPKEERFLILETRHASCVARDGQAVLLLGRSGAGKSDLALRLLDRGFRLVADDRVQLSGVMASPPPALRGLLEVRGLGILRLEAVFPAPVVLVVALDEAVERLPEPRVDPDLLVPLLHLSPWHSSAPLLVEIALDCVMGGRALDTGFLAKDLRPTQGRSVTNT